MIRRLATLVLALGLIAGASTANEAHAAEMGRRFGLGGAINLTGTGGVTLDYWISNQFRLGLLVGYARKPAVTAGGAPLGGSGNQVTANILVAEARAVFVLAADARARFGILGGVGANLVFADLTYTGVEAEVGMHGEVLLSDHFAVSATAGLGLSILANGNADPRLLIDNATSLAIGANVGLGPRVAAGFTWYFDGPGKGKKGKRGKKKPARRRKKGDDDLDDDDDDGDDDSAATPRRRKKPAAAKKPVDDEKGSDAPPAGDDDDDDDDDDDGDDDDESGDDDDEEPAAVDDEDPLTDDK